ncbi:MAG: biotin/lipoyl-binding protein, partial [Spirochaetota bacterium]
MNLNRTITYVFLTHKKKVLVIVLISIVSGIAFSIVHDPGFHFARGTDKENNNSLPGITTVTISIEDVKKKIPVMGNITYRDKATISSKIFGRVEKLYVEQGDYIHRGKPLAKIETHSLELQKKEAMAEMDGAKAALRLSREKLVQAEKSIEQH